MKLKIIGYAVNGGAVPTKTKIYAVKPDNFRNLALVPNCRLVATRYLDGTLIWIRYNISDIVINKVTN